MNSSVSLAGSIRNEVSQLSLLIKSGLSPSAERRKVPLSFPAVLNQPLSFRHLIGEFAPANEHNGTTKISVNIGQNQNKSQLTADVIFTIKS